VAEKASKASVGYSIGHADGDHCGICRHFEPPHTCEIVAGHIEERYWCERFIKRRRSALYDHPRSRAS
jgi:hypothetical protein